LVNVAIDDVALHASVAAVVIAASKPVHDGRSSGARNAARPQPEPAAGGQVNAEIGGGTEIG
jgi:hypothetical protein